jgi:HEAT repeat protein
MSTVTTVNRSHGVRERSAGAFHPARAAALLLVLLAGCFTEDERAAPEWPLGTSLFYTMRLASWVEVSSGQRLAQIDLSARLELIPLSIDDERARVQIGALLSDVRFSGPGHASAAFMDAAEQLARPFTLSLVRGVLEGNAIDPQLSPLSTGVVRTMSAALQFAPVPAKGKVWRAVERDATGRYRVEYRRAGENVFARSKRAYTHVHQSAAPGLQARQLHIQVEHAEGRITVRDGRVATLTASERLNMPLGPSSHVKSQTELTLRAVASPAAHDATDANRFVGASLRLPIDQTPGGGALDRGRFDEQRIGAETFESAIAALEREAERERKGERAAGTDGEPADSAASDAEAQQLSEHTRVFSALSALLRQDAHALDRGLQLVRGGSPVAREILSALGVAGTERAQAALIEVLLDERLPHELRWQACFALSRMESAGDATIEALTAVLDQPRLGKQAAYGLGTLARRLAATGQTERSHPIVALLVQRLPAQASVEGKAVVLRALGNAGNPSALPVARALLDDEDQELRAAAVDALRLMPLPEVDVLLAHQLSREQTSTGRVAVLTAIGAREPQPALLASVQRTATAAEDSPSRARAVRVLDTWAARAPAVRSVLAHIAVSDASEDVRKLASTSLSRMD